MSLHDNDDLLHGCRFGLAKAQGVYLLSYCSGMDDLMGSLSALPTYTW